MYLHTYNADLSAQALHDAYKSYRNVCQEIENSLKKYIKENCGDVRDMLYEAGDELMKEKENGNS